MKDFSRSLSYFGIIKLMSTGITTNMLKLRVAIEASWDADTAYKGVYEVDNPALGNCYPTSRIVQYFFPETEIVEGIIFSDTTEEKHFWNMLIINGNEYHIDFSWQQFPNGSSVKEYKVRDRETLDDGEDAVRRVELLLSRVKQYLQN